MKKFFILISFLMSGILSIKAQDVQLATLQQGESFQVFYGADALKNALDVANDGDLITLTAGIFNADINFTKAVKIQGAGYITDIEKGKYPTIIKGVITLILPDKQGFLIEGIYINSSFRFAEKMNGTIVRKCKIDDVRLDYHKWQSSNCTFDQCRIRFFAPDAESENLHIRNSIIDYIGGNNTTATLFIENCVITNYVYNNTTAMFKNNIIGGVNYYTSYDYTLPSSSSAYNNVFIRGNASGVINKFGNTASDANTLFGYAIDYDDNKTYELTEEAKATFLGTDGTQVGIYGGDTPFTNIPTNPQVTQKNIATKSTPDGKLNVSIKVEAQNQ